jgi:hypothetical protein
LNPNWVRFHWQEYQTKAQNKYFTSHIHTYFKFIISNKIMGSQGQINSSCAEEKNTFGMHDINPRVQLHPDCRGEHIKLKLLAGPPTWTYALVAFLAFSSKNRAFKSSSPSWIQGTQNLK